jgi:ubiquinone/menaquinone biosynthesis C-methylase UbiE
MVKKRVNYDAIAPTYNQRFDSGKQENMVSALLSLAKELKAKRILEVGCGTGRWLSDLQSVTGGVYGLDFSAGMLKEAFKRNKFIRLTRGKAGQLPFAEAAFNLVYCVNAIHHFDCPPVFVSEARRLLKPGGKLAVVGMNPHGCRDNWYVYHYFEGIYKTDLDRFPSWGTVLDWMAAAGFAEVKWRVVDHILDHKIGREVLNDPFLQKNACSQLALLSDAAYNAGLRRIETALAEAEAAGQTLVFRSDIYVGMLVGQI